METPTQRLKMQKVVSDWQVDIKIFAFSSTYNGKTASFQKPKKLFIARHVDVFLTLGLFVEALKIQMEAQACA